MLTYNDILSLPNYNVAKGADVENIQDKEISDYWLERGDYVNIDYVTLGWNVPVRSKYIQTIRVSASVNNSALNSKHYEENHFYSPLSADSQLLAG